MLAKNGGVTRGWRPVSEKRIIVRGEVRMARQTKGKETKCVKKLV